MSARKWSNTIVSIYVNESQVKGVEGVRGAISTVVLLIFE